MAKYAAGKYAYGISDRSGFRYRLKDMRREWTGFLVGKDEWEPKHPQLEPKRHPTDAEALRDPRPDTNNIMSATITFPTFDLTTLKYIPTVKATSSVGTVTLLGVVETVNPTGVSATSAAGSVTISTTSVVIAQTFAVTVASYLGANKYYIDSVRQDTVNLNEGSTYRFDQSDSSNSGHPLRLSTTSDGTHGGGTEYLTGVVKVGIPGSPGAYTQITVATGAPTLYYYCQVHSGMGGQANTP
jgi:Tfp pilus assembly protein PilP